MSYLDDLNKKKTDQSDEQKRLEQINAVKESGDKVVGAVENTKQELSGSLNNLLMATLVAKDPEIVKTAKNLANLSSQIDKATQNIKDSNFKPLADSLKVLQTTLSDIPGQIEQALEAQDPTSELREIANKIGQVKYDPNIRVDVSAPDVDFAPITKLLTNIEKAFKDFKVDIPESDFSTLQSEMRGVKNAIQGLRFPVPNYVLPYQSLSGKSTQVVLDANGNVPVAGSVTVDTTGLATSAKQDTQTGLLTTIDTDTGSIATSASTVAGAVSGTEMQVDVVTSALPTGAATSAKQDTGNTSLSSIDGKITAVNTGAVVVSSSALPSGAATSTIQTDGSQKTQIVDSGGEAVTVTGGKLDVNATISGSGGGTSAIDDAAFAVGTDTGTPSMGLFDDVSPDSVNEGDVGVVRMSANRNAYTTIRDAAGNERGVNVTAGNALTVDASATTQPVSGTVSVTGVSTAANQTTIIGHVDGIEGHVDGIETLIGTTNTTLGTIDADTGNISTKIDTVAGAVSGTEMQVDIVSAPTLTVDLGVNNDVTVTSGAITETNSAAIKTAVETIDNAISGSEMQVDVVGALPAGTNAIGKLSANSGVDIGDVDVTSAVSATMDHGSNLDIDTTAEQITATSFACKFGVTLRAPIANTGILYIGNSDVTASGTAATDGIPLYPGDSLFLPVTNSNIPYAIASANNQTIYWIAV